VVWAVPGEQIDLALPGYGWLYRGGELPEEPAVAFHERRYEGGSTLFLFDAQRLGSSTLDFMREDAEERQRSRRTIRINVVSEEERHRRIGESAGENRRAAEGVEGAEGGGAGRSPAEAAPGSGEAHGKASGEASRERRSAQLMQAAREGSIRPLPVARSLMEEGEEELAEELLSYYLGTLRRDDYRRGEVLYLLGKLYEAPGPLRDERKAVEYYDRAVRGYPGSSTWHRARERSRFLKRNYIHIR
jgi:hypothetical protein